MQELQQKHIAHLKNIGDYIDCYVHFIGMPIAIPCRLFRYDRNPEHHLILSHATQGEMSGGVNFNYGGMPDCVKGANEGYLYGYYSHGIFSDRNFTLFIEEGQQTQWSVGDTLVITDASASKRYRLLVQEIEDYHTPTDNPF